MVQSAIKEGDPPRTAQLLEIDGLQTWIRRDGATVRAVDDVSLELRAGEIVGLVGESGSGKSMTGMSIVRLLPRGAEIVAGRVLFNGRDLVRASEAELRRLRGAEIGLVFQDPLTSLNPTLRIGDQVGEPLRIHRGLSRREARAAATEMLDLVRVPRAAERLDEYPHQLSGGLRQRVVIACALILRPRLLIADEPTTALDVTIQAQILELIASLQVELGLAVLLISHNMGVIANYSNRLAVMYAGRIVETGPTADVVRSVRHPYASALLDAVPQLGRRRDQPLEAIPGLPPDLADLPEGCRFAPRCRYAESRCREEDPPLTVGPDGHSWACHFPLLEERVVWRKTAARLSDGGGSVGAHSAGGPLPAEVEARPLCELRRITKHYVVSSGGLMRSSLGTIHALDDVSMVVREGTTFGLVGESGCGKSTLGRVLVGLENPTSGTVVFDGVDVFGVDRRRRRELRSRLQMMFQDPFASLDPRMRVASIIEEPLAVYGRGDHRARAARVRNLMDEVGLSARLLLSYPYELSGGQRQRVGLARALALDPELIVADEAVSALDVSIQAQVLNLMVERQRERHLSYLFISHDLGVISYIADEVGVLYLGKLVERGPAASVLSNPAHPYTEVLLASAPDLDPAESGRRAQVTAIGDLPSARHPPSGCRFRTRCRRATELCATAEPPLRPVDDFDHEVACHFPLHGAREAQ